MSQDRGNTNAKEHTALSQIFIFSVSGYLSEFIFFLRGLFLARILGPETFGLWVQMRLVLLSSQYGSLGANDAMLREMPYLWGKGKHGLANTIKEASMGVNLLSATMLSALIVLIIGLLANHLNPNVRDVWLILVLIIPVRQMFWFVRSNLRAEKRFGQLSAVILVVAFLTTVFGLISASHFGIRGFLIVFALCHVLVLAAIMVSARPFHFPGYHPTLSYKLIKTGFPIMVSRLLLVLFYNVDKLVIWLVIDKNELGIYSVQTYIFTIIMLVPLVVSSVLYPRIMETFGKTEKPEALAKYLIQPTLVLGCLACFVLGMMFFLLHLPIKWFLSEYVHSITAGKVLLLGSFFRVISNISIVMHVSLRKQNLLMWITLTSILVGVVADIIMIKSGCGLTGVALGTTVSFLFYACFIIGSSTRLLGFSMERWLLFMALTFAPYLAVLVLLGSISYVIPEGDFLTSNEVTHTFIRCITFFIPMSLILIAMYIFQNELLGRIISD